MSKSNEARFVLCEFCGGGSVSRLCGYLISITVVPQLNWRPESAIVGSYYIHNGERGKVCVSVLSCCLSPKTECFKTALREVSHQSRSTSPGFTGLPLAVAIIHTAGGWLGASVLFLVTSCSIREMFQETKVDAPRPPEDQALKVTQHHFLTICKVKPQDHQDLGVMPVLALRTLCLPPQFTSGFSLPLPALVLDFF